MKKIIYKTAFLLSLVFFLLTSFLSTNAQTWLNSEGTQKNKNFYDIQKSNKEYWKDKDFTQRGKG